MARCAFAILIATTLVGPALADPLDEATAAYRHGDYATTVALLLPLADGGDRAAQHNLGAFFADGQGDYVEAGRWFRKAAEQGLAEAQFNLGLMYALGQGVPQDYRQSVRWYRIAARQGHGLAQLNLGAIYANGQGVHRDYVEAYKWFSLAASSLPAAQSESRGMAVGGRNRAAAKMTPSQVAEAEDLAKAWRAD